MKVKEQTITCPECGKAIPLNTALMGSIEEKLRAEMEKEIRAKEKDIEAKAKKASSELEKREEKLSEKTKDLEAYAKDLDAQVELKLQSSLNKERHKIEEQLKRKIAEDNKLEMEDLQKRLDEQAEKIDEAGRKELAFRKQVRDLEQARKDLDLEVQRRLDEERKNIEMQVSGRILEEQKLKMADKEKMIADLTKKINELKQKSEQGSQQSQGEVLEEDIENILGGAFVRDAIDPIDPGKKGADVLQKINANIGTCCGSILWECKRTKNWSDAWIPKLLDDQREAKADISVLVTIALPENVKDFEVRDGVIITRPAFVIPLAKILRDRISEVSTAKKSMEGKSGKKEMLYQFLTSNEFSQTLKAVVGALMVAQDSLEKEKRAMASIWKKREKQIKTAMFGLAEIYGPIRGIVGASLPEIDEFELELDEKQGGTRQLPLKLDADANTDEDKEENGTDKEE